MDTAGSQPQMPLASSSAVCRLVLGLLVVVLDLRVQGFDLLVDALGWIVVVVGAVGELARVVPQLRAAHLLAVIAGVSSADLLPPMRTVVDDRSRSRRLPSSHHRRLRGA